MRLVWTHLQTQFFIDATMFEGMSSKKKSPARRDYPKSDVMATFYHESKMTVPCPCSANLALSAPASFNATPFLGQYSESIGTSTKEFGAAACTDSAFLDLFRSAHCRNITTNLDSPKTVKVCVDSWDYP